MSDDKLTCDRCGTGGYLPHHIGPHERMCQRVPLPAELVAMLDNDPTLTVTDLQRRYRVGYNPLRRRLIAAGVDVTRYYGRDIPKPPPVRLSGQACARCGIQLSHPDVPRAKRKRSQCAWCTGEVEAFSEMDLVYA